MILLIATAIGVTALVYIVALFIDSCKSELTATRKVRATKDRRAKPKKKGAKK